MGNPFAARVAVAAEEQLGLDEVRRICGLPVHRPLEPREVEEVSREELTREAFADGIRLWEPQARIDMEVRGDGGVLAPLRVAGGKTLGCYLALKHAWQRLRLGKLLLMIPSDLVAKAITRDVPKMRKWIGFTAPVHAVAGLPPARRLALCRSGWRGVYVYPYSLLREDQADEELALIAAEFCASDECHALSNLKSAASTKRWHRAMLEHRTLFAGFSGTMAKRSLLNYAHLAFLALGDRCPLPRGRGELETWAKALDEVGREWEEEEAVESMKGLEPMRQWAIDEVRRGTFEPEEVGGPLLPDALGYQRAFRLRRNSAPGVVASSEDAVGVSLVVRNEPAVAEMDESAMRAFEEGLEKRFTGEEDFVPRDAFASLPPFQRLLALVWAVGGLTPKSRGRAVTPNGDPIQYAIHEFKWLYELSTGGFYNQLRWPTEEEVARERGISPLEARDLLRRSKDFHELERKRDKLMRKFLEGEHVPGIDTPMTVGRACALGGRGVPEKLFEAWREVRDHEFDGRIERVQDPVQVCDWKIRAALAWAKALPPEEGALVWTQNVEVGKWAADLFMAELGPERFVHCPSGRKADEVIQDPATARKVVVAALGSSTGGHSRGKCLEVFSKSYFLQFPRSADTAEQAIGRTHRTGQKADRVEVVTNLSLPFDHECFDAMLHDALWLHRTEGEQRIIYASYTESPRLHPTEFLKQRGFDLQARRDMDQALREVFGGQ